MTKNLSALIYMEEEIPEHARRYKEKLKEARRKRARDYQKKRIDAYNEKPQDE